MEAEEAEPTDEELQKEWPYLNRQQLEDLREAFEMFDKRKTGAFTSEDLQKALKDLGEGTSAKDIDNIIAGLDTDGDGVIDFAQFVLVMMHNVRKADPEKDMQGVFSVFDKSGTGMISHEDLRAAIKSMGGQELSEDDISIALGMVEHKDGQIDYQEFLRLIMAPNAPASSRRLKTTESYGDLLEGRRLSTADSLKGSFNDLAISQSSHDGQNPDAAAEGSSSRALHGTTSFSESGMPANGARELGASSSNPGIQPADAGSLRSLVHSKSSKKRAALASDQQKMAALWSN